LNTKVSNQEKNKMYSRLKLRWNLFRFRFAAGSGKPVSAQKFLNRIPLPDCAMDKAAFRTLEKKLWRKYVDRDGNLRIITWGTIFSSLLKTVIGIVMVAALVWGAYHLIAFFNQYKELELKVETLRKFQPDIKTGEEFRLLDGKVVLVDMQYRPVFTDSGVFLPIPVLKDEESHLFYLPGKEFSGELLSLADGRIARKFFLADGKILSYVYNPKGAGIKGTWLEQSQLAQLNDAMKSGNVFIVREGLAAQLRDRPLESAKPISKISEAKKLIFLGFAPISSISSNFIWVQLKYLDDHGKNYQGWMAAVSIVKPYVEVESDLDTLKVVAKTLSFREEPSTKAARIPGIQFLKKGAEVEFLDFAPLPGILSSTYAMIQVKYQHESGKDYTGWIAAGKIKEKFIGKILIH
jgi:hypothetical protein